MDYYVVRFWEDLAVVAQHALVPAPKEIVDFLGTDPSAWGDRLGWFRADPGGEPGDREARRAIEWCRWRALDSGYLVGAPQIWFWRVGDEMYITWRNHPDRVPGVWESVGGAITLEVGAFEEALRTVDREFIRQMGARVEALERTRGLDGVSLDLRALRREHAERVVWFDSVLSTPPADESTWHG